MSRKALSNLLGRTGLDRVSMWLGFDPLMPRLIRIGVMAIITDCTFQFLLSNSLIGIQVYQTMTATPLIVKTIPRKRTRRFSVPYMHLLGTSTLLLNDRTASTTASRPGTQIARSCEAPAEQYLSPLSNPLPISDSIPIITPHLHPHLPQPSPSPESLTPLPLRHPLLTLQALTTWHIPYP